MIGMNFNPPPIEHDNALRLALIYLNAAADPAGSKARLEELAAQTQALRTAIAEHEAAKKQSEAAAAALAGLEQRATELADRENGLIKAQTQLQVASNALASRDEAITLKEQASDRRAAEIDARAKALDDRLAAYRQALA